MVLQEHWNEWDKKLVDEIVLSHLSDSGVQFSPYLHSREEALLKRLRDEVENRMEFYHEITGYNQAIDDILTLLQ